MKAPQEIIDLVARFDQNLEAYQSGRYLVYELYDLTPEEIKIVEE